MSSGSLALSLYRYIYNTLYIYNSVAYGKGVLGPSPLDPAHGRARAQAATPASSESLLPAWRYGWDAPACASRTGSAAQCADACACGMGDARTAAAVKTHGLLSVWRRAPWALGLWRLVLMKRGSPLEPPRRTVTRRGRVFLLGGDTVEQRIAPPKRHWG